MGGIQDLRDRGSRIAERKNGDNSTSKKAVSKPLEKPDGQDRF
jgi:hypothetical protein